MGGGGAVRAAAKITGVTVTKSGFRAVTAEHPISSASGNAVRPVKSVLVAAPKSGSADVSPVKKPSSSSSSLDFDDWEITGGDDVYDHHQPLPRVVFGGAPTLREAKEATSDVKDALERVYLLQSSNGYGGSFISGQDSSLTPFSNSFEIKSKACLVSETAVTASAPIHAIQAFKLLNESPAVQNVVASIACDPSVWNAVLQNPALQDYLESQKSSASFPGTDEKIEEGVDEAEESKSGNDFTGFLQNIKLTVIDMMNSFSDYFQNLFGGPNVSADADEIAEFGLADKTLGSFMGLAVIVIMVVVMKRGG